MGSAVCWGSFLPMSTQVGCPGHPTAPFKTPKRVGPPLCHQGNPHWDGTGLVERVPGWEGGNVFQSCPGKAQARVGESEGGCPLRGGAAEVKTLDLHTGGQADVWKGTEQEDRASPPDSGLLPQGEALFRPPAGASPPLPHCTQRLNQARLWLLCRAATLQASGPGVRAHTTPLGSPWLGLDTHSPLSSTGR